MDPTIADTLKAKLAAARERERDARMRVAQITCRMRALDRRRETQLLCTLGRAWLTLGEQNPNFRASAMRFLKSYISRPADIEILCGTPWAMDGDPANGATENAAPEQG